MSEGSGSGPGDDRAARLQAALVVVLGVAAAVGVLWWAAGSHTRPPEAPDWTHPALTQGEPERYAGAASCRECHPGACAAFARSGHARTLRRAEDDPIARWLDGRTAADPERPGVEWSYHLRDGKLIVDRREGGKVEALPIEFSLGSGRVGHTFVTTMKSGTGSSPVGLEHRLSYIAEGRKLGITPGQQEGAVPEPGTRATPTGRFLNETALLRCFACHMTAGSPESRDQIDPATMIPNVSCERCHGPAGRHLDAARRGAGEDELRMPLGLDGDSPSQEVAACGTCHRTPDAVRKEDIRPDNLAIVRFQPIGLMQSKCFQEGASGLKCTSCHDPHTRVSHDTPTYEAVCVDCHRSGGRAKALCPVSPARGCVACHMPRRRIDPDFAFTDHWIGVHRDEAKAASNP